MGRNAQRLTKAKLDTLRGKAQKDASFSTFVADAGQPGLYAWARRGRVRFVFAYRPPVGGKRRRMLIDEYGAITLAQARDIAQEHRGDVAAGRDPQEVRAERVRQAITVSEMVEGYLTDFSTRVKKGAKRGKQSGLAEATRLLRRNVVPKLGRLAFRTLTKKQVKHLHRTMSATPGEANRTLSALSAVFGYAADEESIPFGVNPCRNVERFEERGERRELKPKELASLGEAMRQAEEIGSVHPSCMLALRLLALTGFRRSEVLGHMNKARRSKREGLRWTDVDLEEGFVRLYDTKTGPQTRVIGQAAVELLMAAKPANVDPQYPVCPGKEPSKAFVGIDKVRKRLYEAAGLSGLEGVDLHSLRHSFASIGANVHQGRYAVFVGPLLGHGYTKRASITDRYIHARAEALRPAADAIAEEIARLLGLVEGGELLAFPKR